MFCVNEQYSVSLVNKASHDQKRESDREEHNAPAVKQVASVPKCLPIGRWGDLSQDAIRLLIGTKAVIENTLANAHKMADVAIQIGKRLDSCHWNKTSAKVNKNKRM